MLHHITHAFRLEANAKWWFLCFILQKHRNATLYLDALFEPVVSRHIPFATVLGNHDTGKTFDRHQLFQHELDHYKPYSFSKMSPEGVPGVSNFVVRVYDSPEGLNNAPGDGGVMNGDQKQHPAVLLWFLDTHGNASKPVEEQDLNWV
jgi:hypothetical protein